VIAGWLTADFREREPQITARMKAMLLAPPSRAISPAARRLSTLDQRELLPKIKSPTLVIAGRHDMATPISAGELIRFKYPWREHDHHRRRPHFQCRASRTRSPTRWWASLSQR